MNNTRDQRLQDIAVLAISALALLGVGVSQVVIQSSASAKAVAAPRAPTQVLGEQFSRPTPTAETPSSRTAMTPEPTTPKAAPKPKPQSPPQTRLYTVTSIIDCGPGGATAKIALSTTKDPETGQYVSDGSVSVTTSVERAIQIDQLTVRVAFDDGASETVGVPDMQGVTLGPVADNTIHTRLTTSKEPTAASISILRYHAADERRCIGQTS
jgi:hypothetical protein